MKNSIAYALKVNFKLVLFFKKKKNLVSLAFLYGLK